MLDRAFEKHFGPLPPQQKQAVIMPKPAQQEQGQKHKPLPQAIAKDNTESTAESTTESISPIASSSAVNTSSLSSIPRSCTMSTLRESTFYLSTTRIQHAPNLAPLFASQHTSDFALASPLSYIRYAEDMEATGQG